MGSSRSKIQISRFIPWIAANACPRYSVLINQYYSIKDDLGNTPSSAAAKTLKDTYANDVVNEKICRRWFSAGGFKKDDFSLKDER
ncbi:hypothetical protein ACTXT7_000545 [Hymenolepis weldensis]